MAASQQAEAGPSTLQRTANDDEPVRADSAQEDEDEDEQEPLDDAAIEGMRRRVLDMGVVADDGDGGKAKGKGKLQATERESELGRLVLQLCEHAQALGGQLAAQAAHIGHVQDQTAHLVEREREERQRWEAERDGWQRTAEVLVLQARKAGNSAHRLDDLEKALNVAHRDNTYLRQQIDELGAQRAILDGQLVNMQPAVLMQPEMLIAGSKRLMQDQHQRMVTHQQQQLAARQAQKGGKRKQSDAAPQASTSKAPAQQAPAQIKRLPPPRYVPPPMRKAPLMSDARHEHLLLAVRKLAHPRAQLAYAAGAYLAAQPPAVQPSYFLPPAYAPLPPGIVLPHPVPPPPEKEKEKEREPPRTPARKRKERDVGPPPVTPKVAGPSGGQQRTPLDSLVSAARMLENGHGGQEQESPSRKRRKLSSSAPANANANGGAGTPSRTMSALDVLAAQAVGSSDEDEDEEDLESEEDAPAPRLATLHEQGEDDEDEEVDELEDDEDVDVDLSGSVSAYTLTPEPPEEPPLLGRGMRNRVPSVKTLTTTHAKPARPARASGSKPATAMSRGTTAARGATAARGTTAARASTSRAAPAPANGAASESASAGSALHESPVAPARIRRMKGQTVWHKR